MIVETKILIIEHDPTDLEILEYELKKGGIKYVSKIVDNEKGYVDALTSFVPDIILSDYNLPAFNGVASFKIRQEMAADTPFIFVSGTIGEEKSIELIKSGLTDYVLKDKMFTLPIKIERALREADVAKLKKKKEAELAQSEEKLARAQQLGHMGSWELNYTTNTLKLSNEAARIFELPINENELSAEVWVNMIHPEDRDQILQTIQVSRESLIDTNYSHRIVCNDGTTKNIYSESKFEFDLY
jgi:two-component system sensor histidine kinase UhpB